ncbi:MAG: hypothetical protein AB7S87_10480 [Burkholderiales bacterium]
MNPSSIYSKTGKGVQEASGKTSHLSRADRAILAAIDGKTTLAQLAAKFDRAADDKFFAVIKKMDDGGFIREVPSGTVQRGAANAPRPSVPPAGPSSRAPAASPGGGADLDFTQIFSAPPPMAKPPAAPAASKAPPAPSRPPPPSSKDPMAAAREAAEARARAEREARAKAEAAEKAAMLSTQQFRLDAEMRAKIEREKAMAAAAEGKTRAEIEARARAEREAKERAEREAREKAEAAERARIEAERAAKERAEREAREARERAEREAREAKERAEREARERIEAAERARRDAAEKARREAEELRQRLEEERLARELAERRAREEAERTKRELEERKRREEEERKAREEAEALRQKLEEERKAREEAERKAREERERRERERLAELQRLQEEEDRRRREEEEQARAAEDAERKAREEVERREAEEHQRQIRLAREAEDRKRRDADARKKKEEEARRWEAEEARRKADDAYRQRAEEEDRLRAEREAQEAAERAEAEKRAAAEADALAGSLLVDLDNFAQREEEERKAKAEEEAKRRAEAERKAKEEEEARQRAEAERKARKAEEKRQREEEEKRLREEAEQREREEEARRKEEEEKRRQREREERARLAKTEDVEISTADLGSGGEEGDDRRLTPEARKALRQRQAEVAKARRRGDVSAARAADAYRRKQPAKWGRPLALFLFFVLVIGAGVANFVPLDAKHYASVASDALGVPVRIGRANFYVLDAIELRFRDVQIGEAAKAREVRAAPELGALVGGRPAFSRVDFVGLTLRQDALAAALGGALQPAAMRVGRVRAEDAKLEGPLALPAIDFDAAIGDAGRVLSVKLTGEDALGTITPRADGVVFEVAAKSFTVPFLPDFSIAEFAMKGSAGPQWMTIESFDGRAFDGTLVGSARIEWGAEWRVQGQIEARVMNAAVFAPLLVSEGRFSGKGRYTLGGPDPAKLLGSARLDGEFAVGKGVLGSFDLSRALQSSSAQASGRTPFNELEGRVSYGSGTFAFRDVRLSSGLLKANASLDVDAKGGLSGRVNAELRDLRGTLYFAGRLGDPQLRR